MIDNNLSRGQRNSDACLRSSASWARLFVRSSIKRLRKQRFFFFNLIWKKKIFFFAFIYCVESSSGAIDGERYEPRECL